MINFKIKFLKANNYMYLSQKYFDYIINVLLNVFYFQSINHLSKCIKVRLIQKKILCAELSHSFFLLEITFSYKTINKQFIYMAKYLEFYYIDPFLYCICEFYRLRTKIY